MSGMKTVVLGKEVEHVYSVDAKQKSIIDEKTKLVKAVYTAKPILDCTSNIIKWNILCKYQGQPRYNVNSPIQYFNYQNYINISEDETVKIEKEIFRADLNECHLYTDKIVKEIAVNLEEAQLEYEDQIKDFNKEMICSNDKLKSYCDVHNLKYEDTDCLELFKVVYSHGNYTIDNGVLKEQELCYTQGTYTVMSGNYINKNNTVLDCLTQAVGSYEAATVVGHAHKG